MRLPPAGHAQVEKFSTLGRIRLRTCRVGQRHPHQDGQAVYTLNRRWRCLRGALRWVGGVRLAEVSQNGAVLTLSGRQAGLIVAADLNGLAISVR